MSYAIQAGDRVFTIRLEPAAWVSAIPSRSRAVASLILGSVAGAVVMWLLLAAPGFTTDTASTATASIRIGR